MGNSQWGFLEGLPDAKGIEGVIKPAFDILKSQGVGAELVLIDRAQKWRPRAEVAAFYTTLDVYLCASIFEGTPNPVLEAMASGVPVVSTDVGIVRYSFGPGQAEFIVERRPEAFARAIRDILSTPGLQARLSTENLTFIRKQAWACRHADWQHFFLQAASLQDVSRQHARHKALLDAAANLRPTLKMRIRSILRRSPKLYAQASRFLHFASILTGLLRVRCRIALDRLRGLAR